MSRPTETRTNQSINLQLDRRQPVQLNAPARPTDQFVKTEPQDNDLLAQFAAGLAQVNPSLSQYLHIRDKNQAVEDIDQGEAYGQKLALSGADPNEIIKQPISMPEGINPAFPKHFEYGFRKALADRIAVKFEGDLNEAWSKVRMERPEEAESFIKEWTAKHSAGFDDPLVIDAVTKRHAAAVKAVRADAIGILQQRAMASAKESVATSFAAIRADQSTAEMFEAFQGIVKTALGTGLFTRTETAALLLERLNAISMEMGGAPELYEQVFKEYKDPDTGLTLAEMNPRLAEEVERARKAADTQLDQKLEQANQQTYFDLRVKWDQRIAAGNPPNREEIRAEIGPRGLFKREEEALAYYQHVQREVMKRQVLMQGNKFADAGTLYLMTNSEDQKKVMDQRTQPLVRQMLMAIESPDPRAREFANVALSKLLHDHASAGAVVPNTILKNRFENIRQLAPGKDEEPSRGFIALSEWYAQMPANIKAAYVTDEDTRAILEIYNQQRSGGPGTQVDAKTAFQAAFRAVSPETKRAVQQQMQDPAFRSEVRSSVKGEVVDFYRTRILGQYPTNEDAIFVAAEMAAARYMQTNPHLIGNRGLLKTHLEKWVHDHYVHDRTANVLVQVPGGRGGPQTADAITEFMRKKVRQYGEDAKPMMVYLGGGNYQLWAMGAAGNFLEHAELEDIVHEFNVRRIFDPKTGEDRRMVALQKSIQDGTATPESLGAEAALIAKARAIGLWEKPMMERIVALQSKAFNDQVLSGLGNLPSASTRGWDNSRLPTRDTAKQDLARRYWDQNKSGQALTVLGEGVVSRVYRDAGGIPTIGVGYNLQANAATLQDDFRRALIPAERIEDIKAGRAELTSDQITRLFDISYGRIEESTKKTVESLYGKDAWAKLGAHRRAVLTDLAFNVGSIKEFPQTLDRFMNEMGSLEEQNFVVHYRNKEGKMIPLEARNNLRVGMLNGMHSFQAIVEQVASKPRSSVQAFRPAQ